MPEPVLRILLTRGTSWEQVRDWRILELTEQPHLSTCKRRGQLSASLTAAQAARETMNRFPAAEMYMWKHDANYIPGPSIKGYEAVRVIAVAPDPVEPEQRETLVSKIGRLLGEEA